MLKRIDSSKKSGYIILSSIFVIMLVANILSPIVSDDYSYLFSFAECKERIDSIPDIFVSLKAHGEYMNGRYTAHFFAHLFLMLPSIIFDIVNALVFTFQVLLIYKLANLGGERKNLIMIAVFGLLWLCQSKFGQVNLWLDGSCNYLFSVVFGLLFISPYVFYTVYDKKLPLPILIPFLAIAFMSGNSMENIAPAFIMMAFLFVLASKILLHKKVRYEQILGLIFSVFGFVLMMIAPGEWINKASDGEASTLITTTLTAFGVLLTLAVPIAIYILLLVRARAEKMDKKIIITSLIFIAGALASNFIMVLAQYYPLRSSIACTTLIIAADAMLYANVKSYNLGRHTALCEKLLFAAVSLSLILGFADISLSYVKIKQNENYIYECKEAGITDVELKDIKPYTKYSELYGLIYLDTERAENWPNGVMAKYYGLNSIKGITD